MSLKGGKQKEDIGDLRFWAQYSGCPKMDSCFNPPLLTHNHLNSILQGYPNVEISENVD